MERDRQTNKLKGALGWSLLGIALGYVLIVAAAGANRSIAAARNREGG